MATGVPDRLRQYLVFTPGGDQMAVTIRGHEIDTADPATFRVFRDMPDGRRVCVAVVNRQNVAGVFLYSDDEEEE